MAYTKLPTRTNANVNAAADMNVLQANFDAIIGGVAPNNTINVLDSSVTSLNSSISTETANRILADSGLSARIDAIAGSIPIGGSAYQVFRNNGSGGGTWGTLTDNLGALGNISTLTMSNQLINTLSIGTAPMVITSTTKVNNLNVDLFDDAHKSIDGAFIADSDALIPSEKAVKYYVDNKFIPLSQRGNPSGVATLGTDGLVPSAQLPSLVKVDTFTVASDIDMMALITAEQGDIAIRTDINKTFILSATPPSTLSNWKEMLAIPPQTGEDGKYLKTSSGVAFWNDTSFTTSTGIDVCIIPDGNEPQRVEFNLTSTGTDVLCVLPSKALNRKRRIEIALLKNNTNYKLIILPHADDPNTLSNDELSEIWLCKSGDNLILQESVASGCWEIISERITSSFRLNTYTSTGSTDSCIAYFENTVSSTGNMMTITNNSSTGCFVTVNRSGNYSFGFAMNYGSSATASFGLSLNSTELVTPISNISKDDILSICSTSTDIADTYGAVAPFTGYLEKNDIIRTHTDGISIPNSYGKCIFYGTYLGN
jgi:hypothetical protein